MPTKKYLTLTWVRKWLAPVVVITRYGGLEDIDMSRRGHTPEQIFRMMRGAAT